MEILIPGEFVELCTNWHYGQSSMMYAISSTGSLALGNIKPLEVESNQEWMHSLLSSLYLEIESCIRITQKSKEYEDEYDLQQFKEFVDKKLEELE